MATGPWDHREARQVRTGDLDLSGFEVTGGDGSIGTVDKLSRDVSASWLVIDTGDWHPHHQVLLPLSAVERVDPSTRKVHVRATRAQISAAPDVTPEQMREARFTDRLAGYYHGLYDTGL